MNVYILLDKCIAIAILYLYGHEATNQHQTDAGSKSPAKSPGRARQPNGRAGSGSAYQGGGQAAETSQTVIPFTRAGRVVRTLDQP